jgi:ubiquinone/menaquinone biosynthesis C-methylase UbiE/GT2 family glycosyltransferase/glycosyltransferase involved in cell wall biosynthesis
MIVVLGMHRSGTSLVGQILNNLGYSLGKHPMPPGTENEKGYFENTKLMEFHDFVLEEAGSHWNDPHPIPAEWWTDSRLRHFSAKLAALIADEFEGCDKMLIKDPRMCRLLPLWRAYFAAAGIRHRWLVLLRHPVSVAKSLERRDGFSRRYGFLLWVQHVLEAERQTRGEDRLLLTHEEVLGGAYAAPIATLLEMSPDAVRESGKGAVEPRLVHHHGSESEFDKERVSLLAKRSWEELTRPAGEGGARRDALDSLWDEFMTLQAVIPSEFSGVPTAGGGGIGKRTSLYCDIGGGFSESAKCEADYISRAGVLIAQFKIPPAWSGRIKAWRWDPIEGSFLACRDLGATDNQGRAYQLEPLDTMGTSDGWVMFATTDPMVKLSPPPLGSISSLTVSARLRPILLSEATDLQRANVGNGQEVRDLPDDRGAARKAQDAATKVRTHAVHRAIKHSLTSQLAALLPFLFLLRAKTRRAVRNLRQLRAFDSKFYESQLPPGFSIRRPIVHYWVFGRTLGLKPYPYTAIGDGLTAKKRVVFYSAEPHTPGHAYRVRMYSEALASRGYDVLIIGPGKLGAAVSMLERNCALVMWRVAWDQNIASLVDAARGAGARIVFDVDDLMFEPGLAKIEVIDGIRNQGLQEDGIAKFYRCIRSTLLAADFCTCPTQPLSTAMRRFNKPTVVLPNGFDEPTLVRSRKAAASRRSQAGDGRIRLGYAGGSRTHQRDFARAAGAVARVLREHPECLLVLFRLSRPEGDIPYMDIAEFPELLRLESQIEWRNIVPHDAVPDELARFDINLAPLETGNPYCEAKSELKYFEAALVDVPTVASPTAPFSAAMRHGETGFLAADEAAWYASLKRLVMEPALRASIARNAFFDVLWRYGPERRAEMAEAFIEQVLGDSRSAARFYELEVRRKVAPRRPLPEIPDFEIIVEAGVRAQSDVAVIIPLYNYAQFVEEALESVRHQSLRSKELIVIDDCSTDDSLAVAKQWIGQHGREFTYVALLKNRQNSGLALTRNAGFAFSEARFVFPLDADNMIEPECLDRCLSAVIESGASVAFPAIDKFGDATGALSASFWHPARLAGGNYIDAMALVRKTAWSAIGGYRRMKTMGWEDFEMWCRFVEEGFWGAWVPERLARYRVHGVSMIQAARNEDEKRANLIAEIREIHPWVDDAALAMTWLDRSALDEIPDKNAADERADPVSPAAPRPRDRERLIELLPLLRCPESGKPLRLVSDECLETEDGSRRWPVKNWRPVFFGEAEQTRVVPDAHLSNAVSPKALELVENAAGPVLNMSAGGSRTWLPNLIELETAIFRNTDVVGDGHALPFADGVFDAVLALNAFEHYQDPDKAVAEILRVLKPGGKVFIHTAFLQPLHEAPWHFFNCTKYGLLRWFAPFEVVEARVSENFNPIYALSWQASELLALVQAECGARSAKRVGSMTLENVAGFWRDPEVREDRCWEDFRMLSQQAQERLAAGFEFIGKKAGALPAPGMVRASSSSTRGGTGTPRPRSRERLMEMLPLLRCPESGQTLRLTSDEWLETENGSRRWPVKDWHPVFFGEDGQTRVFPDAHLSNAVCQKALDLVENAAGPVLNISAGGSRTWLPNLIELETAIFRNTDVVGDGHALPFADGVFDAVLAINAFEHYRDPDKAVAEILRVLKPGGKVFIHTAFLQPLHEAPWHFFNCTKYGLLRWFEPFEVVEVGVSENFNPIYSLSWQASEILGVVHGERGAGAAKRVGAMTLEQLAGFWREPKVREGRCWEDFRKLSQQAQERLAAGFEFIGRKRPA